MPRAGACREAASHRRTGRRARRARQAVRLTRRGRIALTCAWTTLAGVALWAVALLAG